jgi:cytochrome c
VKIVLSFALVTACAAALGGAQAQDAVAGRGVYVQCSACHSTDGSNGVGPSLKGIIGRARGSVAGFHYSRSLKGAGRDWDAASLDAFLSNPQKAIPGNVMPFPGLADATQRANLIAFLGTLK